MDNCWAVKHWTEQEREDWQSTLARLAVKHWTEQEREDWQSTLARLAEFEDLCLRAMSVHVNLVTLRRGHKFLMGLASAFHEVAAHFEEMERPGLLKSLHGIGLSQAHAMKQSDLTLLMRIVAECERRGIRLHTTLSPARAEITGEVGRNGRRDERNLCHLRQG